MKNYTCILIDDEIQAIELLSDSINKYFKNLTILSNYTQWEKGLEALRIKEPDILFLDISINEKNGMDLLKLLPNLKSEVIFVTAHPDYALSAFKFSATGYILKPIEDVDLIAAVDKAIERIDHKRKASKENTITGMVGIPNVKGIEYVRISDIIYLEAINTYTKIVAIDREIISSYNLKKILDSLPSDKFMQIHRSYIVSLAHVKRYEYTGNVILSGDTTIPVSRNYREDFLNVFNRIKRDH